MYRYASKAATAFTTSAADLSRFVLAQLPAVTEKPLDQTTIDAMREPHGRSLGADIWGLGTILYAPTASGDYVFGHDGGNEPAINASARVNPDTGDGIVVLVTGSPSLATELGFHWTFWQTGMPDFFGIPSEVQRAMPALLIGSLLILLTAIVIAGRGRRAPAVRPA